MQAGCLPKNKTSFQCEPHIFPTVPRTCPAVPVLLNARKIKNENYGKLITTGQLDINKVSFPNIVGITITFNMYVCLVIGSIVKV